MKIKSQRDGDHILYPCADGVSVLDHINVFNQLGDFNANPDLKTIPVLDFFSLRSFEEEKYWEWILCDAIGYIGKYPVGNNMLISARLFNLFVGFNFLKSCFYPAKVLYKDNKHDYYVFKTILYGEDFIDFDKSEFNLVKGIISSVVLADYKGNIVSKEQYSVERKKNKREGINLKFKKMVLNSKFDLIILPDVSGFAISEKLKIEIEKQGITGLEITPIQDIEIVVED